MFKHHNKYIFFTGYYGETCDRINSCVADNITCENGGTCLNETDYGISTCDCVDGYVNSYSCILWDFSSDEFNQFGITAKILNIISLTHNCLFHHIIRYNGYFVNRATLIRTLCKLNLKKHYIRQ